MLIITSAGIDAADNLSHCAHRHYLGYSDSAGVSSAIASLSFRGATVRPWHGEGSARSVGNLYYLSCPTANKTGPKWHSRMSIFEASWLECSIDTEVGREAVMLSDDRQL